MVADYLCNSPFANHSQRGWITLASFALQAVGVGALLLLPLLSIQGLPPLQWMAALVAPAPPPGPAPVAPPRSQVARTNMIGRTLMTPAHIPRAIVNLNEADPPPAPELPGGPGVPGGTGLPGTPNFVLDGLGRTTNPMPFLSPSPTVGPVRVSQMMEGNLIH